MFWPNQPRPRFKREMVSPIKTLTHLRRIEAAVGVTCKKCGHVRMIDRERPIKHCQFHRSSLERDAVRSSLSCWRNGCMSRNTRVEALSFSQDEVALRHKRAETILMNLALRVLKDAAYRPNSETMAMTDVRLALRVLYPYMGSRDTLTRYWEIVASPRFHAWENCYNEFAVIAATLVDRGYAVDADFR